MELWIICGYFLVGTIWGVTNALMDRANDNDKKKDFTVLNKTGSMFSNL